MLRVKFKEAIEIGPPWISEDDWVGFYGCSANSAKDLVTRVLQYHLKKGDLHKLVEKIEWVEEGVKKDG
jgi:hypothetical protein